MSISGNDREARTVRSALWAAYGDATGFMTELADSSLITRRTGARGPVSFPMAWQRLIGGRFGALVDLPAGTYSDDTQLRLATSRCIRHNGQFDIDSFAKIEFPVWLNYSLGSGIGSKAAATSLSGANATWYSNFFRTEKAKYVDGGGNGAAMRVQPHVWSARSLSDPSSYLPHVVRNAVVTHGHARGIAGAMLHARALAFVFHENRLPNPDEWLEFSTVVTQLPHLVNSDNDLSTFWLPTWEAESRMTIEAAAKAVAEEWNAACHDASKHSLSGTGDYEHLLKRQGGLDAAQRGSGLKSALFSLSAVWAMRDLEPQDVVARISNVLASDTDTIATMSGALLGALPGQSNLPVEVQDQEYLIKDAQRLHKISVGLNTEDFEYPDLLYWQPPRSSLDVLCIVDGDLVVQGLGTAKPIGKTFPTKQGDTSYQWLRLESGQTILCKRRGQPRLMVMPGGSPRQVPLPATSADPDRLVYRDEQDLFSQDVKAAPKSDKPPETKRFDLDAVTDEAIQSNFNATLIGKHLLRFAEDDRGLELGVAYAAIVLKARRARIKKSEGSK